jgi:hypothetical protein
MVSKMGINILFVLFFFLLLQMQVGEYDSDREEQGRGKAPFDPEHNSTAVYTGKLNMSVTGGKKWRAV